MIPCRRGPGLPHLVLLALLATSVLPMSWTARANARVRDAVQMGDPGDGDLGPAPGPSKSNGMLKDLKPTPGGYRLIFASSRYRVIYLLLLRWVGALPTR